VSELEDRGLLGFFGLREIGDCCVEGGQLLRQAFDLLEEGLVVVWGFGALALLGLVELAYAPETRTVLVLGFLDVVE
jgi:hypothetical protein